MRYTSFFIAAIFAALLFTGCSSPVHIVKDNTVNFRNYKTYMWVETRENENDKGARATAFADLSVHNAVNEELRKAGWREVTDNPDILLSYDVLVQRNTAQQNNPVYSQPFTRMYFNPYTRRWGTIYYPSQLAGYRTVNTTVREGTLTITMDDARTDKTVWQGWTTKQVDSRRLSPEEINRSVKSIFRKFK